MKPSSLLSALKSIDLSGLRDQTPARFAASALVVLLATSALPGPNAHAQDNWPFNAFEDNEPSRKPPPARVPPPPQEPEIQRDPSSRSEQQDAAPQGWSSRNGTRSAAPRVFQPNGPTFGPVPPSRPIERVELAPVPMTEIEARNPPASLGNGNSEEPALSSPAQLPRLTHARDPSTLPDLWRGMPLKNIERNIARITLPTRSKAVASLWQRLMATDAQNPDGSPDSAALLALRLEALIRSGLTTEAIALASRRNHPGQTIGNLGAIILARAYLAQGDADGTCQTVKSASANPTKLPGPLARDAILLKGFCALHADKKAVASLTVALAREAGLPESKGLIALEAASQDLPPKAPALTDADTESEISLIDFALWQRAGGDPAIIHVSEKTTADMLLGLINQVGAPTTVRLAAAEQAAIRNIISPAKLAKVYRTAAISGITTQTGDDTAAVNPNTPQGRATAFTNAVTERTPFAKVRAIRTFLDAARRAGFYTHALEMVGKSARQVDPAAELTWFSETAIEVALANGDSNRARTWVSFAKRTDPDATGNLDHWAALADINDEPNSARRADSLKSVEALALTGRFNSDALHRLATVLDALDYHVPIPLWEAASRTPQPGKGHLPETGVLSKLQTASREKNYAEMVFLTMRALGPKGAEDANLLALGDTIRALKRSGHAVEARQLGFEALFYVWPRRNSG